MTQKQRLVMICSSDLLSAASASNAADAEGRPGYVHELSASLHKLGHEVEIWTVKCDDQPGIERRSDGVIIRRFRGWQNFQAPRVRACGWVAEWVACATSHVMTAPDVIATLITFDWEAGVAGRLLAQRFGFDLVHVPFESSDNDDLSIHSARRKIEDLETSRFAATVVATSPRQRNLLTSGDDPAMHRVVFVPAGVELGTRFTAALPSGRSTLQSISLASLGMDIPDDLSPRAGRRRPWRVEVDQPPLSIVERVPVRFSM